METTKKVKIQRGIEKSKEFGKITKIEFSDKSRLYITKKGWTLVSSEKNFKRDIEKAKKWEKIELLIPYKEINLAIKESIIAGYN